MRRGPGISRALVSLVAAVALTGCGGEETEQHIVADPGPPPSPTAGPPPAASGTEAEALQPLPEGRAEGSVLMTFQGMGELRSPFTGECAHDGPVTEFSGSADGADIVLTFGPDGAWLSVDDVGLRSTAALAAGTVEVDGDHVELAAPLLEGERVIGSVELAADCDS